MPEWFACVLLMLARMVEGGAMLTEARSTYWRPEVVRLLPL